MRIDRKQNLPIDEFKFPCKARQETPANQKVSAPDNSAQKGVSHVTFQPKFPPAPALDRLIDASLFPAITEKTTTMSTPVEPPKDELVPTHPALKQNPLLCRQCQALQFRRPSTTIFLTLSQISQSTPLHPTRESFIESLRLGCRLCILISSFLNLDNPDQPCRPGCEWDHSLTFISLSMSWTKSDNFSAFDSPTRLPVSEPFEYRKLSRFDIVYAMSVSGLATARMPRSTRMEVHRRHASGSCFPEVYGGYR